ncbi:substrate-binding domain-containing protein [Streptococcus uberis]|uniref:substrate-binding domain-containing protein n=1 Tax=Streptococcus uberis TaxID=1349 RepID=UPI000E033632|nr:substrate-binding domain-containing protein [Streptococcus uberis]SUO89045.1 extracellular sugar-binding protein [Streptococcus uberis]
MRHWLQKFSLFLILLMTSLLLIVYLIDQRIENLTKQRLSVGTTYMTMNNPFYQVINAEIEKEITEKGGIVYTRDSSLNSAKQVEQLHYFIKTGVDVIVINPVKSKDRNIKKAVEEAEQKGIKVIVIDSQLSKDVKVTSTIVSDNYHAGELLAKDLMSKKTSARILLLEHKDAVSGEQRIKGFLDTISAQRQFKVMTKLESLGQTEIAMPEVEKIIQSQKDFDVIMALNDQAAIGAVAALDKQKVDHPILVYGVDGSPDMKNLLATTSDVTATVSQSPLKMGNQTARIAIKVANGESVPSKVTVPVKIITKKNIQDFDTKGWQ